MVLKKGGALFKKSKTKTKTAVKSNKSKKSKKSTMNAYMKALQNAKKSNAESFDYNGKKYYRKKTKTGMVIYGSKKGGSNIRKSKGNNMSRNDEELTALIGEFERVIEDSYEGLRDYPAGNLRDLLERSYRALSTRPRCGVDPISTMEDAVKGFLREATEEFARGAKITREIERNLRTTLGMLKNCDDRCNEIGNSNQDWAVPC